MPGENVWDSHLHHHFYKPQNEDLEITIFHVKNRLYVAKRHKVTFVKMSMLVWTESWFLEEQNTILLKFLIYIYTPFYI